MKTFLELLLWMITGFITFSLLWRYLLRPFVFNEDSDRVGFGAVILGSIFWPVALAICILGGIAVGVAITVEPAVKNYLKWLNRKPVKKTKDIRA